MFAINKLLLKCEQLKQEVVIDKSGTHIVSVKTMLSILDDMEQFISETRKLLIK